MYHQKTGQENILRLDAVTNGCGSALEALR